MTDDPIINTAPDPPRIEFQDAATGSGRTPVTTKDGIPVTTGNGTPVTTTMQKQREEKKRPRLTDKHRYLNQYTFGERAMQFVELFFALLLGFKEGHFERFDFLKHAYNFTDDETEPWDRAVDYAKDAYASGDADRIAEVQALGSMYMQKLDRLLDFIGKAEGADYNTIFGGSKLNLTDMYISDIYKLQDKMIADPKLGHSPVGKWQFNKATLMDYVKKIGIDPDTTKFTPDIQRRLAIVRFYHQISSVPGVAQQKLEAFFNGATQYKNEIQDALATVWASIPDALTNESKYVSDGLNKATEPALKGIGPLLNELSR